MNLSDFFNTPWTCLIYSITNELHVWFLGSEPGAGSPGTPGKQCPAPGSASPHVHQSSHL